MTRSKVEGYGPSRWLTRQLLERYAVAAGNVDELKEPPAPQREALIPVVTFAVERRIAAGKSDYWDYATLVELAILAKDEQKANAALRAALPLIREPWEPETTVRNLRLIRETRQQRQDVVTWAKEVEKTLVRQIKR